MSAIYTKIQLGSRPTVQLLTKINKGATKTFVLWMSMIAMMGANFLGSILVSRILGPSGYGDLKFIQTLWMLLSLVFSFGIFHSGTRLLLLENDVETKRELVGCVLLLCVAIGLVETIVLLIIASPIDALFKTRIKDALMLLSPLIITITLKDSLTLVLQNLNKIVALAFQNVFPSLSFVLLLWALSAGKKLSYFDVLVIQQSTLLVTLLIIIVTLKPRFSSFSDCLKRIWEENKSFGWPIYGGSIANVASDYINRLAVAYWMNTTQVGFYSLALTLVEPLRLVPSSIATSEYKNFAYQKKISRKMFLGAVLASLVVAGFTCLFLGSPLQWFYGSDFSYTVGKMSRTALLGAIVIGFGYLFNRFLGAHGQGKILRNCAYIMGGVNIISFLILVPLYGAWGAIWGTTLGGLVYLVSLLYYYRIFSKHTTCDAKKQVQNTSPYSADN